MLRKRVPLHTFRFSYKDENMIQSNDTNDKGVSLTVSKLWNVHTAQHARTKYTSVEVTARQRVTTHHCSVLTLWQRVNDRVGAPANYCPENSLVV